jgi:hypothetical protein
MLQGILEVLAEVICAFTGEVILWVVTLGRRKPFDINKVGNLSTLVGLLFWILVAVAVAMAFLLK